MAFSSVAVRIARVACWVVAIGVTSLLVLLFALRAFGLVIPYRIPTAAMTPTIRPGDQVLMEGLSYRWGTPQRGDVIVFRTREIPAIGLDDIYMKRLAGLPGERVRIADGRLMINGRPVTMVDGEGRPISYVNAAQLARPADELVVPAGDFFVLGDNSRNSADSRYWGFVPETSVRGRIWFRYWPWR
jgi:signal peptidase I